MLHWCFGSPAALVFALMRASLLDSSQVGSLQIFDPRDAMEAARPCWAPTDSPRRARARGLSPAVVLPGLLRVRVQHRRFRSRTSRRPGSWPCLHSVPCAAGLAAALATRS